MPEEGKLGFGGEYEANTHRAHVAAYVLIAGLVLELIHAIIWFHGLETVVTMVAVLLIVGGVWGEVFFGNKARLAGDKQLAEYEARAAEANEKAREAELALAQLEERLSPRKMAQGGQQLIADRISPFVGITGTIGTSPPEIESMRLESAIHGALSMAGWKFERVQPTHTPMWPGGVSINTTSLGLSAVAGTALAEALNEVGIFAVVMPMLEGGDARIFVTVGTKPDADADLSGAAASIRMMRETIGEVIARRLNPSSPGSSPSG